MRWEGKIGLLQGLRGYRVGMEGRGRWCGQRRQKGNFTGAREDH